MLTSTKADILKAASNGSRTIHNASRILRTTPAIRRLPSTARRANIVNGRLPVPVMIQPDQITTRRLHGLASATNKPLFDKILIANRGEIACRVIRTAKKLGIKTVAIYSDVDQDSLHVQMADEAYCVGPAPSSESYLRMDTIIKVAKQTGAQAIHPGYGFLSENAKFATELDAAGLTFIGPPVSAITSMASKSESKDIMLAAGVPCVPGYHGSNQDPSHLLEEAKKIQFPVLIKAVLGGGGKGMRIVDDEASFFEALESARREAQKSFSDDRVLVEKYITKPRHIEVQVFGDTMGNVVSLWERDCSVQRRHQKIIEEAPAPGISEDIRKDLCDKAVAAAQAVGYVGAGTVEFIFDDDTKVFYFMEMNTRLQVEHPITEMITGQDLVAWQLQVASGNRLPLLQEEIPRNGHAFEARIYAENPRNNFLPDAGKLLYMSTPSPSATVRVEEGFKQGSNIQVYYDPLIAKLVVHGENRTEALRVLRKALEEYEVVGLSTNIEFLHSLASHPAFIDGEVETSFIQKHYDALFPTPPKPSAEVLVKGALFVVLRDLEASQRLGSQLWASMSFRRFGGDVYKRIITLQTPETENYNIHVSALNDNAYNIEVYTASGELLGAFKETSAVMEGTTSLRTSFPTKQSKSTVFSHFDQHGTAIAGTERLHIFHEGHKFVFTLPSPTWLLSLEEDAKRATQGGMRAPMPSVVVDVKVKAGDTVKKGQAVVVLESMKTETVLRAETDGVVKSVACAKGDRVEEGTELALIEAN